jgi:hypothetical protein
MSRALRIDLLLNNQSARTSVSQTTADLRKLDAEIQKIGRSYAAAFNGRSRSGGGNGSGGGGASGALDAHVKAYQERLKKIERIEDRFEEQQARKQWQRLRGREERAEKIADEFMIRLDLKKVRAAEKGEKDAVSAKEREARKLQAIEDQYFLQQARRARAEARVRERDQKELIERVKRGDGATFSMLGGLGKVAGVLGGIAAAGTAFREIANYIEWTNQTVRRGVEELNQYREVVKEIAYLKGMFGNTGAGVALDIDFRRQTGQTIGESTAFQQGFMNVAQADIMAGRISEQDARALAISGAKFGVGLGADSQAMGELSGLMPGMMALGRNGKPVGAAEAFAQEKKIFDILNLGRTSPTEGARAMSTAAGYVQAGMVSPSEAAAIVAGVSNTKGGASAGVGFEQFMRSTSGAIGRMRESKFNDSLVGYDVDTTSNYLLGLGAQPGDSPVSIADKIAADVKKAGAEAGARGTKFDPGVYLQGKGYGNMEDRTMLLGAIGMMNTGKWGVIQKAAGAQPDADKAMKALASADKDPTMIARKAKVANEAARAATFAGPMEYLQSLKQSTWAEMTLDYKDKGRVLGDMADYEKGYTASLGMVPQREMQFLYQRMAEKLEAERARVGLGTFGGEGTGHMIGRHLGNTAPDLANYRPWFGSFKGEDAWAAPFYQSAQEIQKAGGEAVPGIEKIGDAAAKMIDAAAIMKQAAGVGGGVPAAPAAMPANAGGQF